MSKGSIRLRQLLFLFFCLAAGYWGLMISLAIKELLKPTSLQKPEVPTSQEQKPWTPQEESAEQQTGYSIVIEKIYQLNGQSYHVLQQCSGTVKTKFHPTTQKQTRYCQGTSRLLVQKPGSRFVVLDTTTANTDADIPVLSYQTQTVPNGSKVILIYERNGCLFSSALCQESGFRSMTHVIDLYTATIKTLSAYPSRSYPYWNKTGNKAVFLTQTCGSTRCDAAPLMVYDINKDQVIDKTTEEGADKDYAMDVTGVKLGYWKSITWNSDTEWQAIYVSDKGFSSTIKKTISD